MPRFVEDSDVKEIRAEWWDEGETVTIRRFNYGDRQALASAAVKVGVDGEGGVLTDVVVGRMNLEILNRGIKRWTLKRADGRVANLNGRSIEALTDEDAEFILAEINAFNPSKRRPAEEQATFRGAGGGGAAGERPAAGGDDGRADLRGDGLELP